MTGALAKKVILFCVFDISWLENIYQSIRWHAMHGLDIPGYILLDTAYHISWSLGNMNLYGHSAQVIVVHPCLLVGSHVSWMGLLSHPSQFSNQYFFFELNLYQKYGDVAKSGFKMTT